MCSEVLEPTNMSWSSFWEGLHVLWVLLTGWHFQSAAETAAICSFPPSSPTPEFNSREKEGKSGSSSGAQPYLHRVQGLYADDTNLILSTAAELAGGYGKGKGRENSSSLQVWKQGLQVHLTTVSSHPHCPAPEFVHDSRLGEKNFLNKLLSAYLQSKFINILLVQGNWKWNRQRYLHKLISFTA